MQIFPIPAFNDNYFWLLADPDSGQAAVVDPGDATPVLDFLATHKLQLSAILITHHHADHIGGVSKLQTEFPDAVIFGPNTPRIPQVTHAVSEGSHIKVLGTEFRILEVPGHTLEHIAYVSESTEDPVLFCGDTLFAGGCGRMFEGTPPMMQGSLQKLASLPQETAVYCAHEYTLSNLRFAAAVMPANVALAERIKRDTATRGAGLPTVPSSIGLELQTNPFLRCSQQDVIDRAIQVEQKAAAGPAAVFGVLRQWKDNF